MKHIRRPCVSSDPLQSSLFVIKIHSIVSYVRFLNSGLIRTVCIRNDSRDRSSFKAESPDCRPKWRAAQCDVGIRRWPHVGRRGPRHPRLSPRGASSGLPPVLAGLSRHPSRSPACARPRSRSAVSSAQITSNRCIKGGEVTKYIVQTWRGPFPFLSKPILVIEYF